MKRNITFIVLAVLISAVIGLTLWLQPSKKPVSTVQSEPAVTSSQSQTPEATQPEPEKPVKAVLLRFAPKYGQMLAYNFEIYSDTNIDFGFLLSTVKMSNSPQQPAKQDKSRIILKASGDLCLKFHDFQSGVWNVAAFMEGVTYEVNNATPAYAATLEFPFVFQMNPGGYLSGFQFVEGIPAEAESFILQMMYSLQTGFPAEAKTEWKTREADANGKYRAEYAVQDTSDEQNIRLNKRKVEYTAVTPSDNMPNSFIRIEKSRNTISVPRHGPWLLTLDGEESASSVSDGKVWGTGSSRYFAHRITKDISGKFPDTFDQFLADMTSSKYKKTMFYATDEQLNQVSANLDLKDALAKYAELLNSGTNNAKNIAENFFVNYLRQNPQACFDLVDALDQDPKREQYDESTQLILWRLLTEAGHTEAQQAVIQAATDLKYSNLTHIRALAYIHDFEYPESFLTEKLWELHNSLPEDSTDRYERELRTMSLYAIGSLGYKDKLNDEIKPEISRQLTENLRNTDSSAEQAVTLTAIGNYGGSETLNDIAPFLSSPEERVRISAYKSMRRMDDSMAVDLLAKSVAAEESPKVREAAYTTLASMPSTSAGVEFAKTEALVVDNPKEQEPLVKVIGDNLKAYPENEQTLRELLEKDPDNRVKREIYRYIVPK